MTGIRGSRGIAASSNRLAPASWPLDRASCWRATPDALKLENGGDVISIGIRIDTVGDIAKTCANTGLMRTVRGRQILLIPRSATDRDLLGHG